MESGITIPGHIMLVGDFNLHVGWWSWQWRCQFFFDLVDPPDLEQHVVGPMHRYNQIEDLITTRKSDSIISNLNILHDSPSDHSFINFIVNLVCPPLSKKVFDLRKWKDLNIADFKKDPRRSELVFSPAHKLQAFMEQYGCVCDILDKHVPMNSHRIALRPVSTFKCRCESVCLCWWFHPIFIARLLWGASGGVA